ncbi:ABC transporter permease [Imperialibacter roseus]|uniref:ABC transporter permease n=1 Tax=Imperialibacter roseus TaxID=1324217 RepID=A0ABZ0ITU9_9BACT|nr:ABC transporter permease [Imperialibacter roseus]WOK08191.1 ABC transporter permease [Imperialibacter roseus]
MKKRTHIPPPLAERLLHRVLRSDLAEEVLGDLEEKFYVTMERKSAWRAKLNYWYQVVNYLRPFAIKKSKRFINSNYTVMFKHNLLLSFRHFMRHKSSFIINLVGLSTGLALTLLIILYARFELSYEADNPLADRIVRITMDYMNGETLTDQDAETYHPMGPRIASEFAEVEDFARARPLNERNFKVGESYFRQSGIFAVDASFFDMFNYQLIHGTSAGLFLNPHEVVLTESVALRYFNKTNVVGETIWMTSPDAAYRVAGVIEDSPANTHLKVNMLISYPTLRATFGEDGENWDNNDLYTYLLLNSAENYELFTQHLAAFSDKIIDEEKIENEIVIAQPIRDIHLYSDKSYELERNGDAASVFILLGVAVLIILMAIANYINLSTSRALDRAKEVGIRKVVGSSVNQLRAQFLTESFLINMASALSAIALVTLSFDWFKYVANLPASFTFLHENFFWIALASFIVGSTLLSGIFPAIILSRFKPAQVLKGKFTHSSKSTLLRKGLVIFQFAITMFLIVQTLIVTKQIGFMRAKDLGANMSNTVVIRTPGGNDGNENIKTFKAELLSRAQFRSATISGCVPGLPTSEMGSTNYVNLVSAVEKQSINFYVNFIDADFVPTMEMEMLAGSNFISGSTNEGKVLVNEESVKMWGLVSPEAAIGEELKFWGRSVTIAGVVKNFHQTTAKSPYIPMIFIFDPGHNKLLSVRLEKGELSAKLETIEKVYASNFSNSQFDFFFLDQKFDEQYKADQQFQEVFGLLTTFAILIACLGLFGLTLFTVAKRTKEIGIRKVLGATVYNIVSLLSRDFMVLIVISMAVALPVTYFLVNDWLQLYAFRIDLSVWYFALPACLVFIIAFGTISIKAFKVSQDNPIDALRDE